MEKTQAELAEENKMLLNALKAAHSAMKEASGMNMAVARELAETINDSRKAIETVEKNLLISS